ncbi:MAG: baseplate J/gp47 family protein [Candidatus Heteroscillospira sp.]|jgi:uncharacterized phage protein gp47/JayE
MRTVEEIYTEMLRDYEERTSLVLRPGGDMSLRLYAVAAQIFALENQLEFSRRQAFPQTAEGEYLDRHAAVRALTRGSAVRATGWVRFFVDEAAQTDIPVPAGVVCTDAMGTQFVTTAGGAIAAGELYCELPVEAKLAGEGGNMPAMAVCCMPLAPIGVSGCRNPQPIAGGSAGESDEQLRQRILDSYSSLPNGANAAYYEEQARSVEGVYAVQVLPKRRGVGTVDVVVAARDGAPEESTVSAVAARLEEQREICVDIDVTAPVEREVDVSVQVYGDASACEAAREALESCFDGALLGRGVLLAELCSRVFAAPGVKNCRIIQPAADISGVEGVLPVLGNLTVTEMEA